MVTNPTPAEPPTTFGEMVSMVVWNSPDRRPAASLPPTTGRPMLPAAVPSEETPPPLVRTPDSTTWPHARVGNRTRAAQIRADSQFLREDSIVVLLVCLQSASVPNGDPVSVQCPATIELNIE